MQTKSGRRKTDRVKPRFRGALYGALALWFAVTVWPTPWVNDHLGNTPVRTNRITGSVDYMNLQGWHPALPTGPAVVLAPPSAEQKVEALPANPFPFTIDIVPVPVPTPKKTPKRGSMICEDGDTGDCEPQSDFPLRSPWDTQNLPQLVSCPKCCCALAYDKCEKVCVDMDPSKVTADMNHVCSMACGAGSKTQEF